MNAAVQLLFHAGPFRHALMEAPLFTVSESPEAVNELLSLIAASFGEVEAELQHKSAAELSEIVHGPALSHHSADCDPLQ